MSTDLAWEEWGRRDPYFGVITDPRFRLPNLTPEARAAFFDSGQTHADYVMQMIRQHIDPGFRPQSVLDFGCGVGRIVVPFARVARLVTGVDVSLGMLREARANCDERGLHNVRLLPSDDDLTVLTREFDLIHSFIVFQHIPPERGRAIIARLLQKLRPGGIGALHFLFGKARHAATFGLAPAEPAPAPRAAGVPDPAPVPAPEAVRADPEMQMNTYNANEILFLIQQAGVTRLHAELTDHGGELGLFAFFRRAG